MSEEKPVQVSLVDDLLTDKVGEFFGRVHHTGDMSMEEVCASAVKRGANISTETMIYAVTMFDKECIIQVKEGRTVHTPLFSIALHIRGVFTSLADRFDRARHTLVAELQMGAELRKALSDALVEIMGKAPDAAFYIAWVENMATKARNQGLSRGWPARIGGMRLKVEGDKPSVGVDLLNEDTGAVIRLPMSAVIENKPRELLVMMIPADLPAGRYRIVVTTQYTGSGSKFLKEPRSVKNDRPLLVV
jgi:hypothetical protein